MYPVYLSEFDGADKASVCFCGCACKTPSRARDTAIASTPKRQETDHGFLHRKSDDSTRENVDQIDTYKNDREIISHSKPIFGHFTVL